MVIPENLPKIISEYDALANIYDLWASADPAFDLTHNFYVGLCSEFVWNYCRTWRGDRSNCNRCCKKKQKNNRR